MSPQLPGIHPRTCPQRVIAPKRRSCSFKRQLAAPSPHQVAMPGEGRYRYFRDACGTSALPTQQGQPPARRMMRANGRGAFKGSSLPSARVGAGSGHGPFKAGSGHVGQGSLVAGQRPGRRQGRCAYQGVNGPRRVLGAVPLTAASPTLTVARRERPRPLPHSDPAAATAVSPARVNRHLRP